MNCTHGGPFTDRDDNCSSAAGRSDHQSQTVQRHMREMGIEGVSPGPNLSKQTKRRSVSLFTAPYHQRVSKPYLGHRYHVHSLTRGLDVSGRDPGLVLTLCRQLGTRSHAGDAVCVNGDATSAGSSDTAHLQQRSRKPFYQSTVCSIIAGQPMCRSAWMAKDAP